MGGIDKYKKQYSVPAGVTMDWCDTELVINAPAFCSIDFRGGRGNVLSMSLFDRIEYFKLLCRLGFKEIEVGFPAASESEFEFCRALIEQNLIPNDVTIQVLCQPRGHVIKDTFEAIKGAKRAIVHLFCPSLSSGVKGQVEKNKKEIIEIAKFGAELCWEYKKTAEGSIRLEFTPDCLMGKEPYIALEACNEVIKIWDSVNDEGLIINLEMTGEHVASNAYARQVEYIRKGIRNQNKVTLSVGLKGVSERSADFAAECILSGAERFEGVLFGNSSNDRADLLSLDINLGARGIPRTLNLCDINSAVIAYEKLTRSKVYRRELYGGELEFVALDTASHNINTKSDEYGHKYLAETENNIIKILECEYNNSFPKGMRKMLEGYFTSATDGRESSLSKEEIYEIFTRDFVNVKGEVEIEDVYFETITRDEIKGEVAIKYDGVTDRVISYGNGRLDCVSNAIKSVIPKGYVLESYCQSAVESKTSSMALSYVSIRNGEKVYWGVGLKSDIGASSISALISAINVMLRDGKR